MRLHQKFSFSIIATCVLSVHVAKADQFYSIDNVRQSLQVDYQSFLNKKISNKTTQPQNIKQTMVKPSLVNYPSPETIQPATDSPEASFISDISGNISIEGRYFSSEGAFEKQQKVGGVSLSLLPEYKKKWDNDHKIFTFSPFFRLDSEDKERTHADIRQLDYISSQGDWEFQVGISKVYWGVAESQHLVDVINQTDGVEGADGEDKLGQPMLRVSRLTENGSVDLLLLPYFRERNFVGSKGRFRSGLAVDNDASTYESSDEEKHLDYAIRWTETMDEFDIGLHYFDGTSRDPTFLPILSQKTGAPVALQAHYSLMKQFGLDLQYTGESTIWKLEAINRDINNEHYTAMVGGFEHTLPSFESGAELGVLAEYHHDSRGENSAAVFQNDLFVGARYTVNDAEDTQFLVGAYVDLDDQSKSMRVEASRRLGDGMKLNIEAQMFTDVDQSNPLSIYEKDDYIQVELQKFF